MCWDVHIADRDIIFVAQGNVQEWVRHSSGCRVEKFVWLPWNGSQSALATNRKCSSTDENDRHHVSYDKRHLYYNVLHDQLVLSHNIFLHYKLGFHLKCWTHIFLDHFKIINITLSIYIFLKLFCVLLYCNW